MQKKLKHFFEQNKGFTLVEMIIVIAVIGIITVVVAPQYLGYIEKSREATDRNALLETMHTAEIAYVGEGKKLDDNSVKVSVAANGTVSYPLPGALDDAVEEIIAPSSYTYKSKHFKGKDIIIDINENGKAVFSDDMDSDLRAGLEDLIGGFIEGDGDKVADAGKDVIDTIIGGILDAIVGEENPDNTCSSCTSRCKGCVIKDGLFGPYCGNCYARH